jgi:hypothetical protein
VLLTLASLLLAAAPVAAQESPAGPVPGWDDAPPTAPGAPHGLSRSIAMRLGYFDQKDDVAGNPFVDESLTVIEPVVVFDWDFDRRHGMTLKAAYDYVSSASIDRLSQYPEQSGASGDFWYGIDFGMRHRITEEWRLGWHLGASAEYDYRSFKFGGDATWAPTDGRDASVTTTLDVFFDDIDVIRFNGIEEGSDQRITVASTVQWNQVLSRRSHGTFGLTLAWQEGFLETPYNGVVVLDGATPPFPFHNDSLGTEITEELPDSRVRGALFGRVRRQLVPGTSVEAGLRFYADDWGIQSVTVEPRLYQILVRDRLMARLRYRYYTQGASDHWVESLPDGEPLPEFRTSDSDLADFDAHSFGLKLILFRTGRWEFDIGVDQVLRSDGLDATLATIGYKFNL